MPVWRGKNSYDSAEDDSEYENDSSYDIVEKTTVAALRASIEAAQSNVDEDIIGGEKCFDTLLLCQEIVSGVPTAPPASTSQHHIPTDEVHQALQILDVKNGQTSIMYLIRWDKTSYIEATWEPPEHILDIRLVETFLRMTDADREDLRNKAIRQMCVDSTNTNEKKKKNFATDLMRDLATRDRSKDDEIIAELVKVTFPHHLDIHVRILRSSYSNNYITSTEKQPQAPVEKLLPLLRRRVPQSLERRERRLQQHGY